MAMRAYCYRSGEIGFGPNVPEDALPVCRVCGCTDDFACEDDGTGTPCCWIEPDLCSACAGKYVGK